MPVLLPVRSQKQIFTTQLGSWLLQFYFYFNDRSQLWTFDMYDATTGTALLLGAPVVLGEDLLEPYVFGIGMMFPMDTTGLHREAGPDDLGNRVPIVYFTPTEAALL